MTVDEKLAAILAAVQTDPGDRGLGRVPGDNLFTACAGDFAAACRQFSGPVRIVTGFYIPSADPPAFETDGPLGAVFLARACEWLGIPCEIVGEEPVVRASSAALLPPLPRFGDTGGGEGEKLAVAVARPLTLTLSPEAGERGLVAGALLPPLPRFGDTGGGEGGKLAVAVARPLTLTLSPEAGERGLVAGCSQVVFIERGGPAADGRRYTMRGRDITAFLNVELDIVPLGATTIGIGDGGNEVGMGKIAPRVIAANIPNGHNIHCRVPTDHLIVAGVSNWGAYALAAGLFVLRGIKPPPGLFDAYREREILEIMVRDGPLVDGVTGKQTATVDGLSWDEYAKPLIRIAEILNA